MELSSKKMSQSEIDLIEAARQHYIAADDAPADPDSSRLTLLDDEFDDAEFDADMDDDPLPR